MVLHIAFQLVTLRNQLTKGAVSIYREELFQDLAKADPLHDISFKILLRNTEIFALLAGVIDEEQSKQITLIAVNTKKWRDAPTERLRTVLQILHKAAANDLSLYEDVNLEDEKIKFFHNAVVKACSKYRLEVHREVGNEEMVKLYGDLIEEQGIEKGIEKIVSLIDSLVDEGYETDEAFKEAKRRLGLA